MARPIRLGLIVPDIQDPTSYYRGIGPLSMLQKQMPELEFLFPNPVNWATLKLCDIIFMQRPAVPDHFNALMMCKDEGIPVWVDFDDDNLSVPKDNPTYHMYSQMPIKDAIVKLARWCDVLTVSTEKLKKKFSVYNKNCFVVPNAVDDFLLRLRNLPTSPREKILFWRGTPTHNRNLQVIQSEVISLGKENPTWKFGFMGHDPIDITDQLKNSQVWPAYPIKEYFKFICQIHPTACYYVLAQNDHSQARSHVSWLEATFSNTLFIGPDHDEFRRPGTLNFKTPAEFKSIMESVIRNEIDIDDHVTRSWQHIQENFMLSKVNNIRANLLKQLHEKIYGSTTVEAPVAS